MNAFYTSILVLSAYLYQTQDKNYETQCRHKTKDTELLRVLYETMKIYTCTNVPHGYLHAAIQY